MIIARDDVHALAEFCSIAPALESPSLLHVRDTAFRKYGEVAHLIDGCE